jgi:hypothetical protein
MGSAAPDLTLANNFFVGAASETCCTVQSCLGHQTHQNSRNRDTICVLDICLLHHHDYLSCYEIGDFFDIAFISSELCLRRQIYKELDHLGRGARGTQEVSSWFVLR